MNALKHAWSVIKDHAALWTSVILVLALMVPWTQPTYIPHGTVLAGFGAFGITLIRRKGVGFAILNLIGAAIAYPIVSVLSLYFIVPLTHMITVLGWSWMPVAAVIALAAFFTAFMARPHVHAIAASDTAATGGDTPAPAVHRRNPGKVLALWFVAALAAGWFFIANAWTPVVQWQMAAALQPEVLTQLPVTVNDRFLPRVTAQQYLAGAVTDSSSVTPMPHLLLTSRGLFWQTPRYDTSFWGNILGSVEGVMEVDAGSASAKIVPNSDNSVFLCGDQSWVTQAVFSVRHPFSEVGETVYVHRIDGSWVLLISYFSRTPTITGTMVPTMAGVMEVTQDCRFRNLGVSEAGADYPGLPLYPTALASEYAKAYGWFSGGFWDVFGWYHKHLEEIDDTTGNDPSANHPPYIQNVKELGLQELIALKPAGSMNQGQGLAEQLYFDALTGKARLYVKPKGETLYGPSAAMAQARQADPTMDQSGRQLRVEPRQVVLPASGLALSKVYWIYSIVQNEGGNHSYVRTIAVDARTLQPDKFGSREEFDAWLQKMHTAP